MTVARAAPYASPTRRTAGLPPGFSSTASTSASARGTPSSCEGCSRPRRAPAAPPPPPAAPPRAERPLDKSCRAFNLAPCPAPEKAAAILARPSFFSPPHPACKEALQQPWQPCRGYQPRNTRGEAASARRRRKMSMPAASRARGSRRQKRLDATASPPRLRGKEKSPISPARRASRPRACTKERPPVSRPTPRRHPTPPRARRGGQACTFPDFTLDEGPPRAEKRRAAPTACPGARALWKTPGAPPAGPAE